MPKLSSQQKEAVRMEILEAAKVVFIERGYEGASMKEIVECSGRSFGGVYLYYSNKEDVFLALLRSQFQEMEANTAVNQTVSAWELLVVFLNEQERRARQVEGGLAPCMFEYFIVGRRDEKRRVLIEERRREVHSHLLSLIQRGIQQNEFQPSKPIETIVNWLISFLDGVYLESILNGCDEIQLADQFELLQSATRAVLIPTSLEV
jgi:AcrR family transcriptional regulator